ncbi:RCC1 domain-containing protein [Actinoplanes sp. GCM10030250]|uniref:RCC1 domain-containing protein n=1 Tax=Actinoplanes sp. GCM10030250 TaxID=3273376 RepID=UPI00360E99AC
MTVLAAMTAGPAPAQPSDDSGARLTAGSSHTCMLARDGKALCWGSGAHGQLGNGGTSNRARPAAVDAPAGVTFSSLTAGDGHTCGLAGGVTAYCWGRGDMGQLGDGGSADRVRPVAVDAPAGLTFRQLTAGDDHTCGLAGEGRAYCWGRGDYGRLGNSGVAGQSRPVVVDAPAGVTFSRLAAGGDHTCGLTGDGRAYCWGRGDHGRLGINNSVVYRWSPVAVDAPAGVTFSELAAGGGHTCGQGNDTVTYCWGEGESGALGDGGAANRLRPTAVGAPDGVTFTELAAGGDHTCALGDDTKAYCWGAGSSGALGDGGSVNRSRPVAVDAPAGVTFTRLAAGGDYTCGLAGDTKGYCWGSGSGGLLGNSAVANQSRPVAVAAPAG